MRLKLIASTGNLKDSSDFLRFGRDCARVCYTEKDFERLKEEKDHLMDRLLSSGHHSVFEHVHLTYYMNEIPKALVMVLNNEKQYVTSEKSARYTQMSQIEPHQKELYDKWMPILISKINLIYPKDDEIAIKKLAQENARYMTSVFTPTKMVHTINFRQLNFLQSEFEKFYEENINGKDEYKKRLANWMHVFVEETKLLRVDGMENQTDRHLSFFKDNQVEEHFGDVYSTNYTISFAGLAQAQRHRTINYNVFLEGGSDALNFFIPKIIQEDTKLSQEWLKDLRDVAEYDFPQAQLLKVSERGILEDFRSKAILRLCGHAQQEIMQNTLKTAEKYQQFLNEYGIDSLKPKCQQDGLHCRGACAWGGKKALERII